MKRLIALLSLMFVMTGVAMALDGTGKITVYCSASASVAVSTSSTYYAADPVPTVDFGAVQTAATCVSPKAFYIWNTSPTTAASIQIYSLAAAVATASGTNWSLATSYTADADVAALSGLVKSVAPAAGNFATVIDASASPWVWTTSSTGAYNEVAAGDYGSARHSGSTARMLWTALKTPTAVSNTAVKTITITVTAAMAG